ncbi:MAG: hypothetical protein AAB444_02835, partial [Patescibacteria group bacterium]
MPAKKKVIELSCRHDPKDPEHLLCVELSSLPDQAARAGRSWKHRFSDLLLIAVVLTLAVVQINAFRNKTRPIPASDVEVKIAASQSAVRVGEEVRVSLLYLNGSEQALSDPRLILKLPNSLNVRAVTGGRWEPEISTILLEDIFALRSGEVAIILDTLSIDEATVEAVLEYRDSRGRIYSRKVSALMSLQGAELNMESFARYYSPEGDQIGRGPLPPKVGEATNYTVFFIMGKILSDFENVVVEGRLQEGVRWTGFTPGGGTTLRFDPVSRVVTWRVGDAHAYFESGHDEDIKGVVFEIAFSPDASMVGKEAPLIDSMAIRGREKKTGKFIERKIEDITTHL